MSLQYRYVVYQKSADNSKAKRLLAEAHHLGFNEIEKFDYADIYFLKGNLTIQDQQRLGNELLIESFLQEGQWENDDTADIKGQIIEIAYRPGVTDTVADQILRCAKLLNIHGLENA